MGNPLVPNKNAAIAEKIGAVMPPVKPREIPQDEPIENFTQALQWLHHKKKLGAKYDKGQTAAEFVSAVGFGAVGALGGVGGAVGGAAGGYIVGKYIGKVGRGVKWVWKTVRSTRGMHRHQAAEVFFYTALGLKDEMKKKHGFPATRHTPTQDDQEKAKKVLRIFFDDDNLNKLLTLGGSDARSDHQYALDSIAEAFRS